VISIKESAYHYWRNRFHDRPVLSVRYDAGNRSDWHFANFARPVREALAERFQGIGANPGLAGLLGEICVAFQRDKFGEADAAGVAGRDEFWFSAPDQHFAAWTARVATRFVDHLAERPDLPAKGIAESIRNLGDIVEGMALDQSALAMVRIADMRGIPWFRIVAARRDVQLGHGAAQARLHETLRSNESVAGVRLSQDKAITCAILDAVGLPVGRHALARSADEAARVARSVGYPVVLKPNTGKKGMDVVIGLTDDAAVRAAAARILPKWNEVVVQSFIPGDDYRMLVVDGRLVAVARRDPAGVTGDGSSSVRQLVEAANRDPRRGEGFLKVMNLITVDEAAVEVLRDQGLGLDSIPEPGRRVRLRKTANMATGGTAADVTDEVHPDNARLAIRATQAIGLRVSGIDFLTPDISRSWREVGGGIAEVNAGIGLRAHWASNPDRDVATPIFDTLYPPGRSGRIPIALVTGSNGKTTTARMVERILAAAGHKTGMATTDEVMVEGEILARADAAGPSGAAMVLRDPAVTAAILETSRGGIRRRGIYVDRCEVAALLNVQEEQFGMDGIETLADLARVKAKVVETGRIAVLNAEDAACVAIAASRRADATLFFSLDPQAPALIQHCAAGGSAVTTAPADGAEWIVARAAAGFARLMPVAGIPATFNGAALVNVANALAAVAIARAMNVDDATIVRALTAFEPSVAMSPGRLNLLTHYPVRVFIDYGHNPPAFRAIVADIKRLKLPGRQICLVSMPGDRPDDQIIASGEAVAGHFDHYICFEEPEWLRGQAPGNIVRLLRAGLERGGTAPGSAGSALTQADAITQAIALAKEGDTILLLGGEHQKAIPQLDAIFGSAKAT